MIEALGVEGERVGGRFVLKRLLGSGGHAGVWLADDLEDGIAVAVKRLHPELAGPRMLERFHREARILETLTHPNIPRLIARSHAEEPTPYLVLELAPGRPLSEIINEHAADKCFLASELLIAILDGVTGALEAAHAARIVHRDLKPSNVLVDIPGDGTFSVKVLDFGVAKALEIGSDEATTRGRVIGSLMYLSPEQAESRSVDVRADVFAMATMLFELVTLRHPWLRGPRGEPIPRLSVAGDRRPPMNESPDVLGRILRGARPSARSLRRSVVESLDRAIVRALAIDPEARFERPSDLVAAAKEGISALDETDPFESLELRPPIEARGAADVRSAAHCGVAPASLRQAKPAAGKARGVDEAQTVSEVREPIGSLTPVMPVTIAAPPSEIEDESGVAISPVQVRMGSLTPPLEREPGFIGARTFVLLAVALLVSALAIAVSYLSAQRVVVAALPTVGPAAIAHPTHPHEEGEPIQSDEDERPAARDPRLHVRAHTTEHPRTPVVNNVAGSSAAGDAIEVRALAQQLHDRPHDADLVARAGDRILAVARKLPDPDLGRSIERRAASAMLTFDGARLEVCAAELADALH